MCSSFGASKWAAWAVCCPSSISWPHTSTSVFLFVQCVLCFSIPTLQRAWCPVRCCDTYFHCADAFLKADVLFYGLKVQSDSGLSLLIFELNTHPFCAPKVMWNSVWLGLSHFVSHLQSQDSVRTPELFFLAHNEQLEDREQQFTQLHERKCLELDLWTVQQDYN